MPRNSNLTEAENARYLPKWVVFSLAIAGFVVTYWLWPESTANQAVVMATLVAVVILWVTEIIPLYISALTGSFLLLALGDFPARDIFSPYFDPVIVLFLGGFILARGMQKYEIDHLIAHEILKRIGDRPLIFVLGLMLVTAFLSMWMSNTAAAAIMIPISIIVLKENNLFHKHSRFAKGAVLAVAYAATIGGIGSLVGSPPNAIAARFLHEENVSLYFIEWMLKTLPFVVLALFFSWALLFLFNKPEIDRIRFEHRARKLDRPQKIILIVFAITVIGWLTTKFTGLSSSVVALIPVISLFALGLLNDTDLSKISWPTLLLFGGGLSLGTTINQVGIDSLVATLLQDWIVEIPLFWTLLILVFSRHRRDHDGKQHRFGRDTDSVAAAPVRQPRNRDEVDGDTNCHRRLAGFHDAGGNATERHRLFDRRRQRPRNDQEWFHGQYRHGSDLVLLYYFFYL